jgi:hypothetical protein
VTLLLHKIQQEHFRPLKSFLLFLNMIRDDELAEIEHNEEILEILRKL